MSVSMTLEDDIDISRGDMIVKENNQAEVSQDLDIMMCWFNAKKMQPGSKFYLRQSTTEVRSIVKEIFYKMDINHLQRMEDDKESRYERYCTC